MMFFESIFLLWALMKPLESKLVDFEIDEMDLIYDKGFP